MYKQANISYHIFCICLACLITAVECLVRDVQYLLTSIRPIHEVLESLGKILYIKYCFVQMRHVRHS